MIASHRERNRVGSIRLALVSVLVLALAFISFISYFAHILPEESEDRYFTLIMAVTLGNKSTGMNSWNFSEEDRTIGLFMNTSWQTVNLINCSRPIEKFKLDEDGNPIAIMAFSTSGIGRGENLSYQITYRVTLKPRSIPDISENSSQTLSEIPSNLRNSYCTSAGPWQVNNSKLRNLAYEAAGNETRVLSIIKKFILWIKKNINYGSLDVPRYPSETVSGGYGDCDDQANLLVTFCRIIGIPAYLQIGCIYLPQKYDSASNWNGSLVSELTRIGWHGWAIVYISPWGWLPVDLTYVSGDLNLQPLNAIKTSAIVIQLTAQYANITVDDYISSSRSMRDFLISNEFYVYEHDTMSEGMIQQRTEETNEALQIHVLVLVSVFPTAHIRRDCRNPKQY